jgi:hypothetical protein
MRLALFFVVVLAGCSNPGIHTPLKLLHDYRGIIHCHSKYSHDSQGTYEEILAAAKAAKVDFICMTDHPPSGDKGLPLREGWRGLHDGVLFIQGAEYSDQILGLGLKEPISGKDRRETIKAIHEQGGVAIACHPEEIADWDAYTEADGMEIYNVHATLKRKSKDKMFFVQVAKALKEDPEHCFQLLQELDRAILKKWDEINRKRPFAGIAGNDAHQNVKPFGLQVDPYPRAFKFVTTHVMAEELSESAILDGLRASRTFVVFEIGGVLPSGTGYLTLDDAGRGTVDLPDAFTVLFRDGEWISDGRLRMANQKEPWIPKQPGVYRFEARLDIADGLPWVVTNPIRVNLSPK